MSFIRGKIGFLACLAAAAIILAAGWYCLMGMTEHEEMIDGTFVQGEARRGGTPA